MFKPTNLLSAPLASGNMFMHGLPYPHPNLAIAGEGSQHQLAEERYHHQRLFALLVLLIGCWLLLLFIFFIFSLKPLRKEE